MRATLASLMVLVAVASGGCAGPAQPIGSVGAATPTKSPSPVTTDIAAQTPETKTASPGPAVFPSVAPRSAEPTGTTAATSAPTAIATASASATLTPSRLSDRERSRNFWQRVAENGGYCGGEFASLAQLTWSVHLIVVGRVVDARSDGFAPYEGVGPTIPVATGVVVVNDILKGSPATQDGTIDVAELAWSGITAADMPADEVLLFLMNEAQQRVDGGYPVGDPGAESRYWRPNWFQAAFRNTDGKVRIPNPDAPHAHPCSGEFPLDLEGQSFVTVVERVRELVADNEPPYVPDELLLIFGQEPTGADFSAFTEEHGLALLDRPRGDSLYFRFRIIDGADPAAKTREVLSDPAVVHATPNWMGDGI